MRDAIVHTAIDRHLARLRHHDQNNRSAAAANAPSGRGGSDRRDDPSSGGGRVSWSELQVEAVVSALTSSNHDSGDRGVSGGGPVPEIIVLVDLDTLRDGWHTHSLCETIDGIPIPLPVMRRMACDANILPAILNGDGETLDVGRARRTANRGQRRALAAMHRTCAGRDCTVPFSKCRIHHIHWWYRDRGDTDIDNLIPLCERHHHLVHDGGWTLTMTPDRVATWTRPDGTTHHTGTCIDRAPHGIGPTKRDTEVPRAQRLTDEDHPDGNAPGRRREAVP